MEKVSLWDVSLTAHFLERLETRLSGISPKGLCAMLSRKMPSTMIPCNCVIRMRSGHQIIVRKGRGLYDRAQFYTVLAPGMRAARGLEVVSV